MMGKTRISIVAGLVAVGLGAGNALAEEAAPKDFTVTGSAALVSDYRFRGVSQSDKHLAVQGGATVTHKSGLYGGFWGSNLAGWGTFGGSNLELDLIAGYARTVGPVTIDGGLTWYMYPGGAAQTDFAEPYVKFSGTAGPVGLLAGVAYAPRQKALGNFSNTPQSAGQAQDNLYVWGDANYPVPHVPVKLKGHLGYSSGNPGLGPNGTSVTPTGSYWDWSLGAEVAVGRLTFGAAWVDTDISKAKAAYLQPNFSSTKDGSSIAGSAAVLSVTAAF